MPVFDPRARECARVVRQLAQQVLSDQRPADRVLSAFFRAERKYGAADRRLISETFYALFRWWGWLAELLPDDWASDRDGGAAAWHAVLLSTSLLESSDSQMEAAVEPWHATSRHLWHGALHGLAERPLLERGELLGRWLGLPAFRPARLVPDWFPGLLPPATDLPALLDWLQRRPPLWLRLQTADVTGVMDQLRRAQLAPQTHRTVAAAVSVHNPRVNLFQLPLYRERKIEVQDLASQVIGLACGAMPGERWWDACAGAGGKSLQLGSLMQNRGTVVATDIRAYKLKDLRLRARRAGLHNISPREWDGKHVPGKPGRFDGVLVDAPCSCTGTWRRNPDARWTTPHTQVAELAALQLQILNNAGTGMKPGGRLVYATCSLAVAENEEVVSRFLAAHPEYALQPFLNPLTSELTDGQLRVWPWDGDCDATFVARFVRR